MEVEKMQDNVNSAFTDAFVHTSLKARLEDIRKECDELLHYTDIKSLKSEVGDLLNSVIQLHTECGWSVDENSQANVSKIYGRIEQYRSIGRKTNVAILGGAFNPPTISHIEIAKLVLNAGRWADEVWIAPTFKHLEGKRMLHFEHRCAMLELAIGNDPRIKVFDYEKRFQLGGETFHFLNKLVHDDVYENYRFAFVIGMDRADTIDTWYNSEELMTLGVSFIVVSRLGHNRNKKIDWYLKNGNMFISEDVSNNKIHDFSSTMFRSKFAGKDWHEAERIVGKDVYEYIVDHHIEF
jgi:nicotinate-nucleotide adenylyltransferase